MVPWVRCSGTSGRRRAATGSSTSSTLEALGFPGPDVDVELIALTARLWRELELTRVRLMINSLGTMEARAIYRERLQQYFRAHESELDEDSRRRLGGNPLRILDSKKPGMRALIEGAPLLTDYLDPESRRAFRRAARRRSMPSASPMKSIRGWCADSTIIRAPCSSGSPMRSAPRTRSARAGATTA